MAGKIVATFVYPIKGMSGVRMPGGINVDTTLGVVGDRTYAIYRKPSNPPEEWRAKGQFCVCMNTEGMAIDSGLREGDMNLSQRPSIELTEAVLGKTGLLGGQGSLVDTDGKWHLADTNKPCVSFLNLASVHDLEQAVGAEIDPRRFRMNVWVKGLEPWAELDYVKGFEKGNKYPMVASGIKFHIDDLCERCRAIEQNPETGLWDLELRQILQSHLKERGYGGSPQKGVHCVMGWLAIPQNNGTIKIRQSVSLGT